MAFLDQLPTWSLAILIFVLRIADVSLGTMRTLSIVRGMTRVAMILGFVEVLIWVTVIAQVISRVHEAPLLPLAYACGFAAGNGVGILLEQKLALGLVVVRIVSSTSGKRIADVLRSAGQVLTTFCGEGSLGPVTLIYATCQRRQARHLVQLALNVDPKLFYVVENAQEWNRNQPPLPLIPNQGWRSVMKKK